MPWARLRQGLQRRVTSLERPTRRDRRLLFTVAWHLPGHHKMHKILALQAVSIELFGVCFTYFWGAWFGSTAICNVCIIKYPAPQTGLLRPPDPCLNQLAHTTLSALFMTFLR